MGYKNDEGKSEERAGSCQSQGESEPSSQSRFHAWFAVAAEQQTQTTKSHLRKRAVVSTAVVAYKPSRQQAGMCMCVCVCVCVRVSWRYHALCNKRALQCMQCVVCMRI